MAHPATGGALSVTENIRVDFWNCPPSRVRSFSGVLAGSVAVTKRTNGTVHHGIPPSEIGMALICLLWVSLVVGGLVAWICVGQTWPWKRLQPARVPVPSRPARRPNFCHNFMSVKRLDSRSVAHVLAEQGAGNGPRRR